MLSRRTSLLGLLSAFVGGTALAVPTPTTGSFTPGPQDRADIARVEAYLNSLKTLKAQFLQVAPDGGLSRGTAWLSRPGRLRFEYDPPAPFLLVAGRQGLVFQDRDLRQTSYIPLSRTPLGILLADKVTLSGDVTVTGVHRLPGQLQIGLVRTASLGDGTLTLIFADNPLTLRQWIVVDAQRKETRVTLNAIELGGRFDPKLFEVAPDQPMSGSSGG
jgi:outer membrane lipoprotein-sorting protein